MKVQRLYPEKTSPSQVQRRRFLQAGGMGLLAASTPALAVDSPPGTPPASWTVPGSGFSNYGMPSSAERRAIRWIAADPALSGNGVSLTPLHELEGTITPNGLHFERHHNGVPKIDSAQWSLIIEGPAQRALRFTLSDLKRYPMQSRLTFIECGGNSNLLWKPEPVQANVGNLHGLVSGCEWTGVPLSVLLDEVGVEVGSEWLIAQGLDASGLSVSLPLRKCQQDVLVALYQNGEALRPENGYPARLIVPGWEGVTHVKWLRALSLSRQPLWSRFDTVSYTDLLKSGMAERMSFEMGVKSIITSPSGAQQLDSAGVYEVRGMAWSGAGKIETVQLSADGGVQWVDAILQEPVLDRAITRFRLPWLWNGQKQVLMSRATDSSGKTQPMRAALLAQKGMNSYYHFNAVCAWQIDDEGWVSHVYA